MRAAAGLERRPGAHAEQRPDAQRQAALAEGPSLNGWLTENVSDAEACQAGLRAGPVPRADDAELAKMTALMKEAGTTPAARREAIEDVFWAVLTSREFLFNH